MKADAKREAPNQGVAFAITSACAIVLITATGCSTMAGYPDQSGDTDAPSSSQCPRPSSGPPVR